MRVGSLAAMTVGVTALLVARPSVADQTPAEDVARGSLDEDLRSAGQGLWFLVSAGLGRLGYGDAARVVSRHIVATAGNRFDVCLAQADVTWRTPSEARALVEWNTLDRVMREVEVDSESSAADIATCREIYRRVTGDLVWRALSDAHCGPVAITNRRLEKVRVMVAAYLAAVEQGVVADSAGPRR